MVIVMRGRMGEDRFSRGGNLPPGRSIEKVVVCALLRLQLGKVKNVSIVLLHVKSNLTVILEHFLACFLARLHFHCNAMRET